MGAYAAALAAVLDERRGPGGADGLEPSAGGVQLRQRVRGRVVAVLHTLTQPPNLVKPRRSLPFANRDRDGVS